MATKAKQINMDPTPHISAMTKPTVLWSSCLYGISDGLLCGGLPPSAIANIRMRTRLNDDGSFLKIHEKRIYVPNNVIFVLDR